ncbi:MAG: hypothetical protein KDA24_19375 [Deltaproteobacteria bacterium]|nr:hypothetical protein [Deltaproteobacteria bacterium]
MTPNISCSLPLCIVAAVVVGCAPVRDDGQLGEGGGGTTLQSAFVATDPWTGDQYQLAYVYLVDQEHTCQQILSNYGVAWWDMPSDVTWVQVNAYKGRDFDWAGMTLRSQYQWNQEGQFDYAVADFFSGSYGDGGYGDDDDDEVPPPPGDGGDPDGDGQRDQEGNIGNDFQHAEDTLTIHAWSGDTVRGDIVSESGEWSFNATYCGDLNGDVVGFGP